MKKFRCPVCGYIYEGTEPPAACPQCKAPGSSFVEVADEAKAYAAEHVVGVASGCAPEILSGLRANFEGDRKSVV